MLITGVAAGSTAALAVAVLPGAWAFPAVAVAGAGLSGTLPLLVTHARRPNEASAPGAVGRILALGAGLGGGRLRRVGLLQAALGYGPARALTVALADAAALSTGWFLCGSVDPSQCHQDLRTAASTAAYGSGSCSCA